MRHWKLRLFLAPSNDLYGYCCRLSKFLEKYPRSYWITIHGAILSNYPRILKIDIQGLFSITIHPRSYFDKLSKEVPHENFLAGTLNCFLPVSSPRFHKRISSQLKLTQQQVCKVWLEKTDKKGLIFLSGGKIAYFRKGSFSFWCWFTHSFVQGPLSS